MTDWSGERFDGLKPSADGEWESEASPLPGGGPGPLPQAVRTRRKRLVVVLVAAGAMAVAVAIVVAVAFAERQGRQSGGTAGDAVKSYLEALSRGDAKAALSYGIDQPATSLFLTGEILKRQVAQWPIRNIKILHDNSSSPGAALSMAHVHVAASFGDQTSDAILDLMMDHNRWKLAAAAIKFTPGLGSSMGNAAAKTVTLFGTPISDTTVYVFPGWIDIGSTSPYLTATVPPLLLDQLTMAAPYWVHPTFVLADTGRDAVRAQLASTMANCQKSNMLAPVDCPVHLDPHGLAEGTAEWGNADLTTVKFDKLDAYRMTQEFSGQVRVPVTVKTSSGATTQEQVSGFLSGVADLATTPPTLTLR